MKRSGAFIIAAFAIVAAISAAIVVQSRGGNFLDGGKGETLLKSIKRDAPTDTGGMASVPTQKSFELKPCIPATGVITLDDETFASGYDELYDHRESYYGRELSVSGYVESENLPPGQFLIGRDLMWCCAADEYFIGFLALIDGSVPRAGSALLVSGTIEPAPYKDPSTGKTFDVPAIRVKRIARAAKFSREVYPR